MKKLNSHLNEEKDSGSDSRRFAKEKQAIPSTMKIIDVPAYT